MLLLLQWQPIVEPLALARVCHFKEVLILQERRLRMLGQAPMAILQVIKIRQMRQKQETII